MSGQYSGRNSYSHLGPCMSFTIDDILQTILALPKSGSCLFDEDQSSVKPMVLPSCVSVVTLLNPVCWLRFPLHFGA